MNFKKIPNNEKLQTSNYNDGEEVASLDYNPKNYVSPKDVNFDSGASYYFKAKLKGATKWADATVASNFYGWQEQQWMAAIYEFFSIQRSQQNKFYALLGCLKGDGGFENMQQCFQACQRFSAADAKKMYFLQNDTRSKRILFIDIYGNNQGSAEISLFKVSK